MGRRACLWKHLNWVIVRYFHHGLINKNNELHVWMCRGRNPSHERLNRVRLEIKMPQVPDKSLNKSCEMFICYIVLKRLFSFIL